MLFRSLNNKFRELLLAVNMKNIMVCQLYGVIYIFDLLPAKFSARDVKTFVSIRCGLIRSVSALLLTGSTYT